MSRSLLTTLAFILSLSPLPALASDFCIINETDRPVWLSMIQKDALRRGKMVRPKTEMCSTYQTRRTLFISVSNQNGETATCHRTLEPGSPHQLFLEMVDATHGCRWAVKDAAARPVEKSRKSLLCSVLAKNSASCKG